MSDKTNNNFVIPERIQIESVFACNASCVMCPVHAPSERKKGVMKLELFKVIIDKLEPYKEKINKVDLWGLGEPLMDKKLDLKIKYAKEKGFKGLAIATNVELLDGETAIKLFKAGLDTIIFSIDGIKKETHEGIRVDLNFERVRENAERAIALRNKGGYATRFVVRFIRQERNHDEWEAYHKYWAARISKDKRDIIIRYDVHVWGGEIENMGETKKMPKIPAKVPCHHLFDRLMVLHDGTVPMCCSDMHHASHRFGNVRDSSPIEVFNSNIVKRYRDIHKSGKRLSMKICSDCTILESEAVQQVD